MRWLALLTALGCICGLVISARTLTLAVSPPAANAAVVMGIMSAIGLCVSILIIWLAAN
jgi:hypothetical protein